MAKVYVAQKDGAEDICVLKQLHIQLEQNSEVARRFYREANIAARLQHPGIAGITDAGFEDDRFCIAMEFIAGQTIEAMLLRAKKKGGLLPLEVTIPIMLQTLDALQYAHHLADPDGHPLGLVHRDLSPRNIMVDYAGRVRVIDFGIAKGEVDEHKTAVGVLMGTPYYMSPEQARAEPVDMRSDLYTVAAVLFEMLVGRRLVTAKGRAKILLSVAAEDAPLLSGVNPNIPGALDPILAKGLAKEAEDRFHSADEFASALRLAAGEAAFTRIDVIGAFLRDLFPEGEEEAAAVARSARAAGFRPEATDATRVAVSSHGQLVDVSSHGTSPNSGPQISEVGAMAPMTHPSMGVSNSVYTRAPRRNGLIALLITAAVLVVAAVVFADYVTAPPTSAKATEVVVGTSPKVTAAQKELPAEAKIDEPEIAVVETPPPSKARTSPRRTPRTRTRKSAPPPTRVAAKTAPPVAPPVRVDTKQTQVRSSFKSQLRAIAECEACLASGENGGQCFEVEKKIRRIQRTVRKGLKSLGPLAVPAAKQALDSSEIVGTELQLKYLRKAINAQLQDARR